MNDSKAPILLKPPENENRIMAPLEIHITVVGHDVKIRTNVPMMADEVDAKSACKTYEEIFDISIPTRMHLNIGILKFEIWRQCLGGQARRHWDAIMPTLGGTTITNFNTGIATWFTKNMDPTAFVDQKNYLNGAKKPYHLSVKETASRFKQIIAYMRYMPGIIANPVYTNVEENMSLYQVMRLNWKTKFNASGNELTDVAYTYEMLVQYMASQERE